MNLHSNDDVGRARSISMRVPDALQRSYATAQSRDPEGSAPPPPAWAPALQRTAEEALRCVRGMKPNGLCNVYS